MKKKQTLQASRSKKERRHLTRPTSTRPILKTASGEVRFRSEFEAKVAADLIRNNVNFSYETVSYDYIISGSYTPDIILSKCVVEVKGILLKEERKRYLAVKAQHPTLSLRFCFQNSKNKLSKAKRSLTYWQWAERHGFLWCNKTIPKEWYA